MFQINYQINLSVNQLLSHYGHSSNLILLFEQENIVSNFLNGSTWSSVIVYPNKIIKKLIKKQFHFK